MFQRFPFTATPQRDGLRAAGVDPKCDVGEVDVIAVLRCRALRGSERAADISLRHTNTGEKAPAKIHIWLPDAIPVPEVLEGYVVPFEINLLTDLYGWLMDRLCVTD
jgi:hypothetical protein